MGVVFLTVQETFLANTNVLFYKRANKLPQVKAISNKVLFHIAFLVSCTFELTMILVGLQVYADIF